MELPPQPPCAAFVWKGIANGNMYTEIRNSKEDPLNFIKASMEDCVLCPRHCHANRLAGQPGFCGQGASPKAARAALHFWEEPCISGTRGSGAVFFSGCSLQCAFCQNQDIALGGAGRTLSLDRLTAIFLELQEKGAHNINLVTPGHFIPQICFSLERARAEGLSIPVVYNTGSYEEVESLKHLEGLIDIYLPDFKYFSSDLSLRCSHAPDYFEKASAAIAEMFRQVGRPVFQDASPLMRRGMIVRHLLLPGQTKDSKKILRHLHTVYGNDIYVSIMNQYTPLPSMDKMPEFNRRVTPEEYRRVLDFADRLGITRGFIQEEGTADASFIPAFDGEGL